MSDSPKRVPLKIEEARVRSMIAGGTAGVGLATARRFAMLGAPHVAINGRTVARGETAKSGDRGRVFPTATSTSSPAIPATPIRRSRSAARPTRRWAVSTCW